VRDLKKRSLWSLVFDVVAEKSSKANARRYDNIPDDETNNKAGVQPGEYVIVYPNDRIASGIRVEMRQP